MLSSGGSPLSRSGTDLKLHLAKSFVALFLIFPASLLAQGGTNGRGDCDPGLKRPEGNPSNSYTQRAERCEGIYAREIAATNLGVVSYTSQFENFDPATNDAIRLEWSTPVHDDVHIRAVALRPRFFYRMDAVRPTGPNSWMWPTDVLKALNLDRPSLGVVATTIVALDGVNREVYLPLWISSKGGAKPNCSHEILLRSDVELSEVYVSVAELSKSGKTVKNLWQNKPLLHGVYPAERGIPIRFGASELREKTIYRVDIGATLRTGGSASMGFWIYGGS